MASSSVNQKALHNFTGVSFLWISSHAHLILKLLDTALIEGCICHDEVAIITRENDHCDDNHDDTNNKEIM